MKTTILSLILVVGTFRLIAQPTGWNVDNVFHVSFKYNNGGDEEESSHWQPGNMVFWSDDTYQTGSTQNAANFRIDQPTKRANLDIQSLVFENNNAGAFVDRILLDYNGLDLVNGNSWRSMKAGLSGNSGQLDLYTGFNGNRIARLGPTSLNSGLGSLRLYNFSGNLKWYTATTSDYGYSIAYGTNGKWNSYVGTNAGNSNTGYVSVHDVAGNQQAGMYINGAGQGVIFADIKNFRISNPMDETSEIWYASLEGPEAGAYDRGTAMLVDGEIFVRYSDHFMAVANPSTMTVSLTPLAWDTYGLAVVEKSAEGFHVKELKAGTGNFAFDWEVKCVRNGKENYEIIRAKVANNPSFEAVDKEEVTEEKVKGSKSKPVLNTPEHHQCTSTRKQ